MYMVYALIDQRMTAIRYVGMTNDLVARYSAHITNREVNREKNLWIDEMRSVGMIPYCRTLEVCEDEREARDAERKWIEAFREVGEPLFNVEATGRQR